jgi:hypothetical protein
MNTYFPGNRIHKYSAVRTEVDGIKFPSKREANRYQQLKILEQVGEISGLERQPKYPIVINGEPVLIRSKGYPNGRKASYKADFRYFCNKTKKEIVEDAKGMPTEADVLRRAIVEAIYGIRIQTV